MWYSYPLWLIHLWVNDFKLRYSKGYCKGSVKHVKVNTSDNNVVFNWYLTFGLHILYLALIYRALMKLKSGFLSYFLYVINKKVFFQPCCHRFKRICTQLHVSNCLRVKEFKNVNMKTFYAKQMHMSSLPNGVFGSFPVCCCIDIIQKLFLHFYFHIDYTFNVVRNECIQIERSAFVWIFELRQIMQHNCSYYNRKTFLPSLYFYQTKCYI